MWRQLWKDAKPKGGAQESVDFQKLMKPDKARNYKEFKKRLLAWDIARQEEDQRSETGEALTSRLRAMALLWMMPTELEVEVLKSSHSDPGIGRTIPNSEPSVMMRYSSTPLASVRPL